MADPKNPNVHQLMRNKLACARVDVEVIDQPHCISYPQENPSIPHRAGMCCCSPERASATATKGSMGSRGVCTWGCLLTRECVLARGCA